MSLENRVFTVEEGRYNYEWEKVGKNQMILYFNWVLTLVSKIKFLAIMTIPTPWIWLLRLALNKKTQDSLHK